MKNTTQRIIAIVLLILLCVPASLVAEVIDIVEFHGFGFNEYRPETKGLQPRVNDAVDDIIDNTYENKMSEKKPDTTGSYALVGYSQGGLRALATATGLKRSAAVETYNNLKAVITVSGANKGLKALEGGFAPISARLMTDVRTLWRGVLATFRVSRITSIFANVLPKDISAITKLVLDVMGSQGYPVMTYLGPALNGVNPDSVAEIRDMIPHSEFIQENVADTKTHKVKEQTGSRLAWEWRKAGRWFRYLVLVRKPVYSYFSYGQDIPKFDQNLPVGYIVGTKNDTLSMIEDGGNLIRDIMKNLHIGFAVVEGIHYARSFSFWGMLSGSIWYGQDARRARQWTGDVNGQIDELLGSSEHDGLIARESQYYPWKFTDPNTGKETITHNNMVKSERAPYVGLYFNHASIVPFDDVKEGIKANEDTRREIERLLRDVN